MATFSVGMIDNPFWFIELDSIAMAGEKVPCISWFSMLLASQQGIYIGSEVK